MTTKRGRKSDADLAVVAISDARIQPPEHLTEEQASEWRAIVNSLPADYFRPGDVPLLAAFCAASALHKQALQMIQKDGIVLHDGGKRLYAHPAKDILTSQASAMAQMAVKLRLCQSTRMTDKAAGAKAAAPAAKRPWDKAA